MKKLTAFAVALMLLVGIFAGCAPQMTTLTIFTWEGMFPQEMLDGFEEATGYSINYINFDYDETMLTKLQEAKGGDYDLIIADDYIIETVIAEGLARKLDKSKIANLGNINPVYQGQFFDPQNEYTVPYGAGVQTIVYDPALVDIDITGYADLFDPSLRDSIGVISNYRVVNGMALKILHESYNTEDPDVIRAAGDLLLGLAPNVRVIKDENLQEDLLSGEIFVGVMYTSQVTIAKLENPGLKVVYPIEGIGFGTMAGFVPSKAPNAAAAYAFLDYILDGQRGAQGFEWLGYYSTNKAADEYISPEFRDFLTLPAGFISGEAIQNISEEANALHELIWTEFKNTTGK